MSSSKVGSITEIHDGEGRFMLPGFIDEHTHLDNISLTRSHAEYTVTFGHTTVVSEVAMATNSFHGFRAYDSAEGSE